MEVENKLSNEDIKNLIQHHDSESKIMVIEKMASQYENNEFTSSQIELANDIFKLLLKQAEVEVRKALSDNLMNNKSVPHDIIFSLARDVEEVSLPVLEFSEVLTNEDLIEIVSTTQTTSSHIAIANRSTVSPELSDALVKTHNSQVVGTLLRNDKASISDQSYDIVLNDFSENESIVDSMISRGSLSSTIVDHMTEKVSEAIQKKLEAKYEHSFKDLNQFFKESSEVATFKFLSHQSVDTDLIDLVDSLEESGTLVEALDPVYGTLSQLLDGIEQVGQLTPLSAISVGHLTLFEIALSRLTGVPLPNVQKLVRGRQGGLNALYHKSELPPKLYEAVLFITGIIQDMDAAAKDGLGSYAKDNLHNFVKRIINDSKGKNIPNITHFISVIRKNIEESPEHW